MKNNPEVAQDTQDAVKAALAAALVFAEAGQSITFEGAASRPFPVESDGIGQTTILASDTEVQTRPAPASEAVFERAASAYNGEVVTGSEQAVAFVLEVGATLQDFRAESLTRDGVKLAA